MRKTTRKAWALAAGVTSIALVATACSSSDDPGEGDETADGSGNITLTGATFNEFGYTEEMFDRYEAENPGVTLPDLAITHASANAGVPFGLPVSRLLRMRLPDLIGEEAVLRYHGGRVEATGFQVADAAVAASDDGVDDPVGSVATADVAAVLGKKPQSLSPARDSLLKKGLIYSGERGRIAFTVPHFGRYLRTQA